MLLLLLLCVYERMSIPPEARPPIQQIRSKHTLELLRCTLRNDGGNKKGTEVLVALAWFHPRCCLPVTYLLMESREQVSSPFTEGNCPMSQNNPNKWTTTAHSTKHGSKGPRGCHSSHHRRHSIRRAQIERENQDPADQQSVIVVLLCRYS